MMILADQHLHTSFSADSEAPLEAMAEKAVSVGLKRINITDHNDFLAPAMEGLPEGSWDLDVHSYHDHLLSVRDRYAGRLEIGFGIELGLTDEGYEKNLELVNANDFEFIIGSIHFVDRTDTYDPKFYEGRTKDGYFNYYYDAVYRNITRFKNFDIMGHLDYLTQNMPDGEDAYDPYDYMDRTDEILKYLIENGKGIEVNTKALFKGFKNPNPFPVIVKRYKELGGEIITAGSDAHKPAGIAFGFDRVEAILKDAGFKYYTVFKDRKPVFLKLD